MAITTLAITYNMAEPDDSFSRCGKVPTPAYIWAKRDNGDAITEVKVVYDKEEPGADFVKLEEDLNKNVKDKPVYLCYKKGGSNPPIVDLKIFSDEDPIDDGFVKVDKDVTRVEGNGLKSYVYIKPQTSKKQQKK